MSAQDGCAGREENHDTRGGRSRLCLTIADDAGDDKVWVIHHSTEADAKGIPELATFVDTSWSLRIDVTGFPSISSCSM